MPTRYFIHPDHRLLIVEATGEVVDADFFAMRDQIYKDPGYAQTELRLYDVRGLKTLQFSAFTVWKLAYEGLMRAGSRRAIVTGDTVPVEVRSALQLMRMIQNHSTFITTDIKTARAWLGLPADSAFGAEKVA
jgi:hypothetical protein